MEDDIIQCSSAAERARQAREFATETEINRNRHVLYDLYTVEDEEIETGLTVDDFVDAEPESAGDITGVTVLLEHEGTLQQATVTGRKQDQDRNAITSGDYLIEFPDGTQEAHQYSVLLDAIYSQFDENGDEWFTFKDIIAHEQ